MELFEGQTTVRDVLMERPSRNKLKAMLKRGCERGEDENGARGTDVWLGR